MAIMHLLLQRMKYRKLAEMQWQIILFIDLANYYENRSGTDLSDPGLFLICYTFSAALLIFLHCEGKVDKVE